MTTIDTRFTGITLINTFMVSPAKKDELIAVTDKVSGALRRHFMIDVDLAGSIGRRYRRQDEVGTPLCVTVDFDTLEDQAVTIRERDAMTQDRVALDGVTDYLAARLKGC